MQIDETILMLSTIKERHQEDYEKAKNKRLIKIDLKYIYNTLSLDQHRFIIITKEINKEHKQIFFMGIPSTSGEFAIDVDFAKLDIVLRDLKEKRHELNGQQRKEQSKIYMQIIAIGISILALVLSGYVIFIKPNSYDAKIELLENQIAQIQKQISNK